MATLNVKQFPEDLYAQLRALAEEEHRSVAQQVIHLIDNAIRQSERRSILELRGLGKRYWKDIDSDLHIESERAAWD